MGPFSTYTFSAGRFFSGIHRIPLLCSVCDSRKMTLFSIAFPRSALCVCLQGDEFGRRGAVVELSPAGQEEVTRTLADDGSIILPQVRGEEHVHGARTIPVDAYH